MYMTSSLKSTKIATGATDSKEDYNELTAKNLPRMTKGTQETRLTHHGE